MVLCKVFSLFTNEPWKMNQLNWLILLRYKPLFYFDGKVSNQADGVAIAYPLGPALTNLFMVSN